MDDPRHWDWALAAAYGLVALWSCAKFFTADPHQHSRIRLVLAALAGLHLCKTVAQAAAVGRVPFFHPFEFLSGLALGILLMFLLLELRFRDLAGAFIPLLVALGFQLAAAVTHAPGAVDQPAFRHTIVGVHTIMAILVYSFFTIGAAACLMYLFLYAALKGRRFEGVIFRRLPSLARLERLGHHAMAFGTGIYALFLAEGFVYVYSYVDPAARASWDAKFTIALVSLALYLLVLAWRWLLRRPWREAAVVGMLAYLAPLASLAFVEHAMASGGT